MTTTATLWGTTDQVDSDTTNGTQFAPVVVGLSNGNYLVAYTDTANDVSVSAGFDIIGVIYGPEGDVVVGPVQLNDSQFADEERPSIAATNDGGFVMAYVQRDPDGNSILVQRLSADAGSSFFTRAVLDPGTATVYNPSVAVNPADNSMFVSYAVNDGSDDSIRGVRLDPDLNFLDDITIRSDDFPTDNARGALENESATLSNGNIVTVFGEDDADRGIDYRINDATTGNSITALNVGNTPSNGFIDREPQVAALAGGGFVVVWVEVDGANNLRAAIFDNAGNQVVAPTDLFSSTNDYVRPDVIGLKDGGFFVVARDNDQNRLEGTRYDAAGTAVGTQFFALASANTPDNPELGLTTDGRILLTWADVNGDIFRQVWDPRDTTITADGTEGVITARATDNTTIIGSASDETILGGTGDDSLYGDGGVDSILGGEGDDYIEGGESFDDTLRGGDGNDTLEALGGGVIEGNADNDTFIVRDRFRIGDLDLSDSDVFDGGDGIDVFDASNETLFAYAINLSAETLDTNEIFQRTVALVNFENATGSQANDTITGDSNANVLKGEGGGDSIDGGVGDDSIEGGAGNDTLLSGDEIGAAADTLRGGSGDDVLQKQSSTSSSSISTFDGGDDTDLFFFAVSGSTTPEASQVVDLSAGRILFNGLDRDILIDIENVRVAGDAGIVGDGNANHLSAVGDGANSIEGGGGDDTIDGGAGDDTLNGGSGQDLVEGEGGDDRIIGSTGLDFDTYDGGADSDTVDFSTAFFFAGLRIDLDGGQVRFNNFSPNTVTLISIENAIGTGLDDEVIGDAKDNVLRGLAGNDMIEGDAGRDEVFGGDNNDRLLVTDAGHAVSGETYNGGTGQDVIDLFGAGAFDFSGSTVTGIEEIEFASADDKTAIFNASVAANPLLLDAYGVSGVNDVARFLASGDASLAALTFQHWVVADDEVQLIGGTAAQSLTGSSQNDRIEGGAGNDSIEGGAGRDEVFGGDNNDRLLVTDAGHAVAGEAFNGGGGQDVIEISGAGVFDFSGSTLTSVEEVEFASADDKTVILNASVATNPLLLDAYGEAGVNDIVRFLASGNASLAALTFQDWRTVDDEVQLIGGAAAQSLTGSSQNDRVEGLAGNDSIEGAAGRDEIYGGGNDDRLRVSDAGHAVSGETYNGGTGQDVIELAGAGMFDFSGSTLTSIEEIEFASADDKTAIFNASVAANPLLLDAYGVPGVNDVARFLASGDASLAALSFQDWRTADDEVQLVGGMAAQSLTGSSQNDRIEGLAGNDTIEGGAGRDEVFGGDNNDRLLVTDAEHAVAGEAYNGGSGQDVIELSGAGVFDFSGSTLTSIEEVEFASADDKTVILNASVAANPLLLDAYGVPGVNDVARFLASGDASLATLNFQHWVVTDDEVQLVGGTAAQSLTGSSQNDRIEGRGGNDSIAGGDGNDTLIGGTGEDLLHGSLGLDTADYSTSNARVVINLETGYADGGTATGDSLLSIEGLVGSKFGDRMVGTSGGNRLFGQDGADYIDGGASRDLIFGGSGNDTLIGGSGNDVFIFEAAFGDDRINDFEDGADRIQMDAALGVTDFGDVTVTTSGVDLLLDIGGLDSIRLIGANGNVTLTAADFIFE